MKGFPRSFEAIRSEYSLVCEYFTSEYSLVCEYLQANIRLNEKFAESFANIRF